MSATATTEPIVATGHERLWAGFDPDQPAFVRRLRERAWEAFAAEGFPTPRQEAWRSTNVGRIAGTEYRLAEPTAVRASSLERYEIPGSDRLVLVNGRFVPELSRVGELPRGTLLGGLAELLEREPARLEPYLGSVARLEGQPFAALATAFLGDGAVLIVPDGAVLERPVQVLHLTAGGGAAAAAYPRTLLVVGEAAQATVVERYVGLAGLGGGATLDAPVTEIVVGDGAHLDHVRLQWAALEGDHLAAQASRQGRSSTFRSHAISAGAALARTDLHAVLDGEGADCTLNGLYVAGGSQHVDTHMTVEHAKPHGASHELYKGVLDGKARAVFNGLIHVHQDAQKTDAKQSNRNLLLSREAVASSNPQLLIFADDVRCTHGSTVGQLDDEAIFYLRSRGIGRAAAESLLTYAFAVEVLEGIRVEPVRAELEEFLLARLPGGETVRQAVEG